MELDILRTTGCKWSKIIYPGYKGVSRPYQSEFNQSVERPEVKLHERSNSMLKMATPTKTF